MRRYDPPLEQRAKFQGLRLDFNERLAPLPEKVVRAVKEFDPQKLMLYPSYGDLVGKIANYAGVDEDNLMITNGSDQGMELIFRTFVAFGDFVIIPAPSFAMFYQVAQVLGAKILKPQYKSDGSFPLEEVLQLLKQKPRLLIICNPNNPTGTLISLSEIEIILKCAGDTIVYIDEAYFEFSGVTAVKLIKKYSNLFITRTFSKAFGLAALRIGYIMSCAKNINEMMKVRGPYDVNQMAKVAVQASLDCQQDVQQYCEEVMKRAKPMVEKFFREKRIEFLPSGANFIYFIEPFENFSAALEENGILIRPQAGGYARVTIGTIFQMKKFIQIFNKLIS